MGRILKAEENIREKVLGMMWTYVQDNFHKFSEANKIALAKALLGKNIPQQLDGTLELVTMPTITINGQPLELKLGKDGDQSS